ncbi:MAG: hypothetical protein GX057_06770 [Clostridiales bacterium]|nr:hypothetical protein [Clostridiales bacterium]HOA84612.1 hypothetical protein [Bacillota bacterium]
MKNRVAKIILEMLRHHMSAYVLVTLINIILISQGAGTNLYFSAFLPRFVTTYAYYRAGNLSYPAVIPAGILTALLFLSLFALCVVFSYRAAGWLLCGAGLVAADTAVIIWWSVWLRDSGYIPEILINLWVIMALVAGYVVAIYLQGRRPRTHA